MPLSESSRAAYRDVYILRYEDSCAESIVTPRDFRELESTTFDMFDVADRQNYVLKYRVDVDTLVSVTDDAEFKAAIDFGRKTSRCHTRIFLVDRNAPSQTASWKYELGVSFKQTESSPPMFLSSPKNFRELQNIAFDACDIADDDRHKYVLLFREKENFLSISNEEDFKAAWALTHERHTSLEIFPSKLHRLVLGPALIDDRSDRSQDY